MFFHRQFTVFVERHHAVLDQRGTGGEDPAVVGGDDKQQDQQAEQPDQPGRKHVPHGRGQHQLAEDRFELLGFGTAFAVQTEIFLRRSEIDLIRAVLMGERFVDADPVFIRRDRLDLLHEAVAFGLIGDQFVGDVLRNAGPDGFGILRIIGMVQDRNDGDRDQNIEDGGESAAPVAEDRPHFAFMRTDRGIVAAGDAAGFVQHHRGKGYDQGEKVEIAQMRHIIRIQKTFARYKDAIYLIGTKRSSMVT